MRTPFDASIELIASLSSILNEHEPDDRRVELILMITYSARKMCRRAKQTKRPKAKLEEDRRGNSRFSVRGRGTLSSLPSRLAPFAHFPFSSHNPLKTPKSHHNGLHPPSQREYASSTPLCRRRNESRTEVMW